MSLAARIACCVIVASLHCPSFGRAADHALLIGVSDYPPEVASLTPRLNGPENDVPLMYAVSKKAGIPTENITVLTDTPATTLQETRRTAFPLRAEILSELTRLSGETTAGDRVLIYLSGHGGQLPDQSTGGRDSEPDGLDEVFLPADFTLTGGKPQNAIRDDEIGRHLDTMLAKGTHVLLIADTCHAGTLRRDSPTGLTPRMFPMTSATETTPDTRATIAQPQSITGQFIAFYGAKAGALAYEREFERDGTRQTHGLLTWAFAEAVQSGARNYQELAGKVRSAMWQASAGQAQPAFSGALGLPPMIGNDPLSGLRFSLFAAGNDIHTTGSALDGFQPGQEVILGLDPDTPLATARIGETGLSASEILLPPADSHATQRLDELIREEGLDPKRHRARWLAARAPAFILWPKDTKALTKPLPVRVGQTISVKHAAVRLFDHLPLTAPTANKDARAIEIDLAPNGTLLHVPELDHPLTLGENHHQLLDSLQKRHQLLSVAQDLAARPLSRTLRLDLTTTASASETCSPNTTRTPQTGETRVHHCDLVEIRLTNDSEKTFDITPLYLAPDGSTYFLSGYPRSEQGGLRLPPGTKNTVAYREHIQPSSDGTPMTGEVALVFLAVEADEDGHAPVDFRHLESGAEVLALRSADQADARFRASGAAVLTVRTVAE